MFSVYSFPMCLAIVGWSRTESFSILQKLNSSGWVIIGDWQASTMVLWLKFSRKSHCFLCPKPWDYLGPRTPWTNCPRRIVQTPLCSAIHPIGNVPKYAPVSACTQDTPQWLPVPQRISYRIAVMAWCWLIGIALTYLRELCCPALALVGRRALC